VCARPQPRRNRFSWKIPAANEGCEKKRLKEGIARKGRFMPMKRLLLISFLLLVISAQNVSAIPAGTKWLDTSQTMPFNDVLSGSPIADVECNVYRYEPDPCVPDPYGYVYTYQITNISDVDLTWFSVTFDAVNVYEPSWDSDPCLAWVDPDYWDIAGSPVQSVEGIFTSTIGPSESSAILWFASDNGYGIGTGALAGISSGYVFASGELIVPIPEPATLLLLGSGGLVAVIRKRRPG
jgi:hypothetical protein